MPALVELQFSRMSTMCPLGQDRRRYHAPENSDYLFLVITFSEAHGPLARDSISGGTATSLEAKGPSCSFSCVKVALSTPPPSSPLH